MEYHDEASASGPDSQMNFMRMMACDGGGGAAGSGAAAAGPPAAPPPPPPGTSAAPVERVEVIETEIASDGATYFLRFALPPGFHEHRAAGGEVNPVFVLDRDEQMFTDLVAANRAEHAAVSELHGRNWYPKLMFCGPSSKQAALTPEQWVALLPKLVLHVEQTYQTYRFSRSLCGLATDGGCAAVQAALHDDKALALFSYFVVGSPEGIRAEGPRAQERTAIAMCVSASAEEAQKADAVSTKAGLEASRCPKSTITAMVVDRYGAQHYVEQQTGYGVEVLEYADERERSRRVGVWLGDKLERRKLERLGGTMPWHEFK